VWPSVEMRELKIFLTLAEELHFGRTADRLQLTHSRVSQCIAALEARVGAKLFERTSRRVQLTPLGEQLRTQVAPAYDQIQHALADLYNQASGISGLLQVGVYSRVGTEPLIKIIKIFGERYPQCTVRIAEIGVTVDHFAWLRRGDLDLLVMRLPAAAPDLIIGPILTHEERVLVLARDHPLATYTSVCVEDLADYTTTDVEGAPREVMDVFSPPVTPSGRTIRRTYLRSIAEAATRAATGEIVHPTVPSFLAYYPLPTLVSIPIRDLPPSQTALVRAKANKSIKVSAFLQVARDVIKGQARGGQLSRGVGVQPRSHDGGSH
jgi:DNA-binding transcriptional LysR family regulator